MKKLVLVAFALGALITTGLAGYSYQTIQTPQGTINVTIWESGNYIDATYNYPDGSVRHATGYRWGNGNINWQWTD